MIELGKKYQTRDGRAVRILATDLRSNHPIAGVVTDFDFHEWPCSWTPEGFVEWGTTEAITDLISAPTKLEGWGVVITSDPPTLIGHIFMTKEGADHWEA